MKYVVDVNGRRSVVELSGEQVRIDDAASRVRLVPIDGTPVSLLEIDGRTYRVLARRDGARGRYVLSLDGRRYEVDALDERTRAIRDLSAASAPSGPTPLVAPMPGLVVRVAVQPGDAVRPGQGLVVMEAMKMENELRSQSGGTVRAVLVAPGTAVEKGAVLVELE